MTCASSTTIYSSLSCYYLQFLLKRTKYIKVVKKIPIGLTNEIHRPSTEIKKKVGEHLVHLNYLTFRTLKIFTFIQDWVRTLELFFIFKILVNKVYFVDVEIYPKSNADSLYAKIYAIPVMKIGSDFVTVRKPTCRTCCKT